MNHNATAQLGRLGVLVAAATLALSACSGGDDDAAGDASRQVQSAKSQASSMVATATGDGASHCSLKVNGKDVQAVAKNISCDDVPKLWDAFPKHAEGAGSGQVSYKGRTYRCSIAQAGDSRTGACLDDKKSGFTFAG